MSADNYIRIYRKRGKFIVAEGNASTGFETKRRTFKTLNSAINYANDYTGKNIVEYGIKIDPSATEE